MKNHRPTGRRGAGKPALPKTPTPAPNRTTQHHPIICGNDLLILSGDVPEAPEGATIGGFPAEEMAIQNPGSKDPAGAKT